jgi:hypothetical protein
MAADTGINTLRLMIPKLATKRRLGSGVPGYFIGDGSELCAPFFISFIHFWRRHVRGSYGVKMSN